MAIKLLALAIMSITISSCMHVGMMGTGDGDRSGTRNGMTSEPVLEKEVTVGDMRAVATFPPLNFGEDVTLTLRLMNARTSTPISSAQVYLHAQYAHRLSRDHDHDQSSSQRKEREHDINIDQEVTESSTPGVYTIPYGSFQPGEHTLMFHISAIGDRRLDPEITVEATRTVPAEGHDHQSGMMGGTSTTTYVIIGAAVMGAMMIAMLAARGGMF